MKVDFYFSVASRYSYLAFTQLPNIAELTGCAFHLKPLNNRTLLERVGHNPFAAGSPVSGQYDWAYREYDATCWADFYGVPFSEPAKFRKDPQWLTLGCHAAMACGDPVPFLQSVMKAIFCDGKVIDEAMLLDIAVQAGISRSDFLTALESGEAGNRVQVIMEEALHRGVFGVPAFFVEEKMFWGNDRIPLLIHELNKP